MSSLKSIRTIEFSFVPNPFTIERKVYYYWVVSISYYYLLIMGLVIGRIELEDLIEQELQRFLLEEKTCSGNAMHNRKGRFSSKMKSGSYSLSSKKLTKDCDRETGQKSRRKGSTKGQQDNAECGRKNRDRFCRGGNLKEQDINPPEEQPPLDALQPPQTASTSSTYQQLPRKPVESLQTALEPKQKIVHKLGLSVDELATLMEIFLTQLISRLDA